MDYECQGCGKTGSGPLTCGSDIYPRMIFNHRSEVLCERCKTSLEEWLTEKWREWFVNERAKRPKPMMKAPPRPLVLENRELRESLAEVVQALSLRDHENRYREEIQDAEKLLADKRERGPNCCGDPDCKSLHLPLDVLDGMVETAVLKEQERCITQAQIGCHHCGDKIAREIRAGK